MTSTPTYQQIIDMGSSVVPILLRELRRRPNHWFSALERITGQNPVDHTARGKLDMMTKAWLTWGRESHSF